MVMVGLSQGWESQMPSHLSALVGRSDFTDWDSEISRSLLFQLPDFTLTFKYTCALVHNCKFGGERENPEVY